MTDQDDIIREFLSLGTGISKVTKEITGEELKDFKREVGEKHPIDVVGTTSNFKVGYEVWSSNMPAVSNIIHKLNLRKNRKDITHWAVVAPYEKALKIGADLATDRIRVVSWDQPSNTGPMSFMVLGAFPPRK